MDKSDLERLELIKHLLNKGYYDGFEEDIEWLVYKLEKKNG